MRIPGSPHPTLKKYYQRDDDRQRFVTALFDSTARYYNWSCAVGSLGSGQHYRRSVLRRSGLRTGMTLLDVATGTGLVARAASTLLPRPGAVIGVDPSAGMLRQGRSTHSALLVQGMVEGLPFSAERFDFLTMGYALRHVADLRVAFAECLRVLKPGGRLLILEITPPSSAPGRWLARAYFNTVLPLLMRIVTGSPQAEVLMRYHWDTIVECVPASIILDVLRASGFTDVERRVQRGLFSEYLGIKPPR